ncbi:hypothetical protein Q5X48_14795 [Acinetobacter baumannii]|nr:hypothetical protein [Acinetobacter baumannii]
MKIKKLSNLIRKVQLHENVNLDDLLAEISKLPLKNHHFELTDIQVVKNERGSLYQVTYFNPDLMDEILLLIGDAGTNRQSAANQNMSHNYKVEGSFLLIRQAMSHPQVVIMDVTGEFFSPVKQSRIAVVVENRQIFLFANRFKEFLIKHTDVPVDENTDFIFGAGNELPNSYHAKFLQSYDHLYLCLDMDLGGLMIANNLMSKLKQSNITFVQPHDIQHRLKAVRTKRTHDYLLGISNFISVAHPALKPYAQLIRSMGCTLEQESFL